MDASDLSCFLSNCLLCADRPGLVFLISTGYILLPPPDFNLTDGDLKNRYNNVKTVNSVLEKENKSLKVEATATLGEMLKLNAQLI